MTLPNPRRTGRKHRIPIDPSVLAVAEALRVNDAVQLSGLSRSSLYKLINSGRLASVMVGGRRLVLRRGLVTLLQTGDAIHVVGHLQVPQLRKPRDELDNRLPDMLRNALKNLVRAWYATAIPGGGLMNPRSHTPGPKTKPAELG